MTFAYLNDNSETWALDPFAHHPELRGKIADPLGSFRRSFNVETLIKPQPRTQGPQGWAYRDDVHEADRARILAEHGPGELWVFAYGALMWDPAIRFSDVRRATVHGFARRFILVDDRGGRGTRHAPGLMAALDHGDACHGLIFRIAADEVEAETEVLWRRELVGPGVRAAFVPAVVDGRPIKALSFVADHRAYAIRPDMTRSEQIRHLAQGSGFLGTSLAHLESTVRQFARLGIADAECSGLLKAVKSYLAQGKAVVGSGKSGPAALV